MSNGVVGMVFIICLVIIMLRLVVGQASCFVLAEYIVIT